MKTVNEGNNKYEEVKKTYKNGGINKENEEQRMKRKIVQVNLIIFENRKKYSKMK